MLGVVVLDNKISSSTNRDLVGNMTRQDELTLVPADLNLSNVSLHVMWLS